MIGKVLKRVGPRPLLLTRYVAHKGRTRVRLGRLRRDYDRHVVQVAAGGRLCLPSLELTSADELPQELQAAAQGLRAEAEMILGGFVDYLGSGPVSIGPDIDWHCDFKSGYRWPPTTFYQDLEVTRLTDASDAKVTITDRVEGDYTKGTRVEVWLPKAP